MNCKRIRTSAGGNECTALLPVAVVSGSLVYYFDCQLGLFVVALVRKRAVIDFLLSFSELLIERPDAASAVQWQQDLS